MDRILPILIESIPGDVRPAVRARHDFLTRQLAYLAESNDRNLVFVRRHGWSVPMLEVVMALNSFYQIVLAPLASSGRSYQGRTLGSEVPIKYGESMRFDQAWGEEINAAYSTFKNLVKGMGIRESFLYAQRTEDVIYRLMQDIRRNE